MEDMKFRFTIQDYQTDAVNSVVKVFQGQPFQDRISYRRDTGSQTIERNLFNYQQTDEELYMGFANEPLEIDSYQILKNIQDIQNDNNIKESEKIEKNLRMRCLF